MPNDDFSYFDKADDYILFKNKYSFHVHVVSKCVAFLFYINSEHLTYIQS